MATSANVHGSRQGGLDRTDGNGAQEPALGFIVTIDGPAGAGKSTVARELARRLRFRYMDTGAMYRAATLAAQRAQLLDASEEELAAFVGRLKIECVEDRVFVNGEDVTDELRTRELTQAVRRLANTPAVREKLVALQRAAGYGTNLVTEGRDQGTVVFPDADVKIYLTATPGVRAARRRQEFLARGESVPFQQLLQEIIERDRSDQKRQFGPLVPADDAIIIDTSDLNVDDVVDRVERIVRQRMRPRSR